MIDAYLLRWAVDRIYAKTEKDNATGCINWTGGIVEGRYGIISIRNKTYSIHRLVWQNKYGTIKNDLQVCHKCDNKKCVNIDHLFLGTQKENIHDMIRKGRKADVSGEKHPLAKLTWGNVKEIKQKIKEGVTQKNIAKSYGVTRGAIEHIVFGKTWTKYPDHGGKNGKHT